eukprot:PhM_4_TR16563/c0_g1_i1/m.48973
MDPFEEYLRICYAYTANESHPSHRFCRLRHDMLLCSPCSPVGTTAGQIKHCVDVFRNAAIQAVVQFVDEELPLRSLSRTFSAFAEGFVKTRTTSSLMSQEVTILREDTVAPYFYLPHHGIFIIHMEDMFAANQYVHALRGLSRLGIEFLSIPLNEALSYHGRAFLALGVVPLLVQGSDAAYDVELSDTFIVQHISTQIRTRLNISDKSSRYTVYRGRDGRQYILHAVDLMKPEIGESDDAVFNVSFYRSMSKAMRHPRMPGDVAVLLRSVVQNLFMRLTLTTLSDDVIDTLRSAIKTVGLRTRSLGMFVEEAMQQQPKDAYEDWRDAILIEIVARSVKGVLRANMAACNDQAQSAAIAAAVVKRLKHLDAEFVESELLLAVEERFPVSKPNEVYVQHVPRVVKMHWAALLRRISKVSGIEIENTGIGSGTGGARRLRNNFVITNMYVKTTNSLLSSVLPAALELGLSDVEGLESYVATSHHRSPVLATLEFVRSIWCQSRCPYHVVLAPITDIETRLYELNKLGDVGQDEDHNGYTHVFSPLFKSPRGGGDGAGALLERQLSSEEYDGETAFAARIPSFDGVFGGGSNNNNHNNPPNIMSLLSGPSSAAESSGTTVMSVTTRALRSTDPVMEVVLRWVHANIAFTYRRWEEALHGYEEGTNILTRAVSHGSVPACGASYLLFTSAEHAIGPPPVERLQHNAFPSAVWLCKAFITLHTNSVMCLWMMTYRDLVGMQADAVLSTEIANAILLHLKEVFKWHQTLCGGGSGGASGGGGICGNVVDTEVMLPEVIFCHLMAAIAYRVVNMSNRAEDEYTALLATYWFHLPTVLRSLPIIAGNDALICIWLSVLQHLVEYLKSRQALVAVWSLSSALLYVAENSPIKLDPSVATALSGIQSTVTVDLSRIAATVQRLYRTNIAIQRKSNAVLVLQRYGRGAASRRGVAVQREATMAVKQIVRIYCRIAHDKGQLSCELLLIYIHRFLRGRALRRAKVDRMSSDVDKALRARLLTVYYRRLAEYKCDWEMRRRRQAAATTIASVVRMLRVMRVYLRMRAEHRVDIARQRHLATLRMNHSLRLIRASSILNVWHALVLSERRRQELFRRSIGVVWAWWQRYRVAYFLRCTRQNHVLLEQRNELMAHSSTLIQSCWRRLRARRRIDARKRAVDAEMTRVNMHFCVCCIQRWFRGIASRRRRLAADVVRRAHYGAIERTERENDNAETVQRFVLAMPSVGLREVLRRKRENVVRVQASMRRFIAMRRFVRNAKKYTTNSIMTMQTETSQHLYAEADVICMWNRVAHRDIDRAARKLQTFWRTRRTISVIRREWVRFRASVLRVSRLQDERRQRLALDESIACHALVVRWLWLARETFLSSVAIAYRQDKDVLQHVQDVVREEEIMRRKWSRGLYYAAVCKVLDMKFALVVYEEQQARRHILLDEQELACPILWVVLGLRYYSAKTLVYGKAIQRAKRMTRIQDQRQFLQRTAEPPRMFFSHDLVSIAREQKRIEREAARLAQLEEDENDDGFYVLDRLTPPPPAASQWVSTTSEESKGRVAIASLESHQRGLIEQGFIAEHVGLRRTSGCAILAPRRIPMPPTSSSRPSSARKPKIAAAPPPAAAVPAPPSTARRRVKGSDALLNLGSTAPRRPFLDLMAKNGDRLQLTRVRTIW